MAETPRWPCLQRQQMSPLHDTVVETPFITDRRTAISQQHASQELDLPYRCMTHIARVLATKSWKSLKLLKEGQEEVE